MKKNTSYLALALLFSITPVAIYAEQVIAADKISQDIPTADKSNSDEQMAEIALTQLASMIHSFIGLAKDPNNPSVVANTVGTLISGIATIVSEGFKARVLKPNATEQEILTYLQTFGAETRLRLAKLMEQHGDEICAMINQ